MGKFRESQTAINLHTSFAAEAQARTRYNFLPTGPGMKGLFRSASYLMKPPSRNLNTRCGFSNFSTGVN